MKPLKMRDVVWTILVVTLLTMSGCDNRDQDFALYTPEERAEATAKQNACCQEAPSVIVAVRIDPQSIDLINGTVLDASHKQLIVDSQAWQLLGEPRTLPDDLTREIGQLVVAYHANPPVGVRKLCGTIEPVIALQMETRTGEHCWVLICFKCQDWGFYPANSNQVPALGDFSAFHDPLLKAMKSTFPEDALIQSIAERGPPSAKPGVFR